MSKRNSWLGGVLVVIIAAGIIFAVVHKSNKLAPTASTNTGSSAYSQPSSSSSNTPAATSSDIITTKTDPTAGEFLAASNSKPLYTYGADTTGVSNCSGACIADWPIYSPLSSSTALPANVTIIQRSDGKAQYAYKGMPLYYFSSDSGSTPTGDGVGNFHLAKP